jgi:hypothetical protein
LKPLKKARTHKGSAARTNLTPTYSIGVINSRTSFANEKVVLQNKVTARRSTMPNRDLFVFNESPVN